MRVFEGDNELPIDDGVVSLVEWGRYRVTFATSVNGESVQAFLSGVRLKWDALNMCFPLHVGNQVGAFHLEVTSGTVTKSVRVNVLPKKSVELDARMWSALVADLDAWLSGVTVGVEGASHGSVATAGAEAPLLTAALLPLLPALQAAVGLVLASPRERVTRSWEDVPMHAVRAVDGALIRWLVRNPEASAVLHGAAAQSTVPQRLADSTLDHPVNRYLAWLLRRALTRLKACADDLERLGTNRQNDDADARWMNARAQALREGIESLEPLLKRSFLRKLRPEPASEAALVVLQDDPLYARVQRLARPFLSPRFRLESKEPTPEAPVRPSYELYELWTFLALQRLLAALLPDARWSSKGMESLVRLGSTGGGARFHAQLPDGSDLDIHFNLTFRSILSSGTDDRFSITGERRPDLVVTWRSTDEKENAWLCLDAKYRAGRTNLADAFSSLHMYRDSLRWKSFGGRSGVGWLLVPARSTDCERWFSPEFFNENGIGAVCLTPGEPLPLEFGRAVLSQLGVTSGVDRQGVVRQVTALG